jgi:chromosome segregation ATPase
VRDFSDRTRRGSALSSIPRVAEKDDDIERRVGALEGSVQDLTLRVRRSEQDAAAARVLAGGAERDVGELRGEMRGFRTEVHAEFADVRTAMRAEFADVRGEMRAGFADVRNEIANVRAEMGAEFADVRGEIANVRAEMGAEFANVRSEAAEFRSQNNRVLSAMRADITDLREHVDRGFLEIRGRLDATAAGQQTIVDLLGTLIARDERGPEG